MWVNKVAYACIPTPITLSVPEESVMLDRKFPQTLRLVVVGQLIRSRTLQLLKLSKQHIPLKG